MRKKSRKCSSKYDTRIGNVCTCCCLFFISGTNINTYTKYNVFLCFGATWYMVGTPDSLLGRRYVRSHIHVREVWILHHAKSLL